MAELYPIKFEAILKERIWGGSALVSRYNKKGKPAVKYGESWEISAVSDNISVVSNGFLAGNNLQEIIEVYMGDITGDAVYDKFGPEFPLLIKLIEAREYLSIQVHPGDELALERHKAYGKTEMWYVLDTEGDARIFTGFREQISKEKYLDAVSAGTLAELMYNERSAPGSVYFIPSGTVHAIGAGNILAEIQQTSDITYRIFDWNRTGADGQPRELHTELAVEAIDFNAQGKSSITIALTPNKTENLVRCSYFTTNAISFSERISKDYNLIDSFVIFICTEGEFLIRWEDSSEPVRKGETVLLPAMIKEVILEPLPEAKLLEIFISDNTGIFKQFN
jgi:mannose-6-phosphate isomerase